MRDRRFIAVHRGGPLEKATHQRLAAWAADCAEHLLPCYTGDDAVLRHAIATGRAWSRGEVPVGRCQKASVACHAAARAAIDPATVATARAVGHAVATAHFAEHCLGVVIYGRKAVEAAGRSVGDERQWQLQQLPESLRELIESALERRLGRR